MYPQSIILFKNHLRSEIKKILPSIEVVPIKTYTPLAVSFATSERDIRGFGAIDRGRPLLLISILPLMRSMMWMQKN